MHQIMRVINLIQAVYWKLCNLKAETPKRAHFTLEKYSKIILFLRQDQYPDKKIKYDLYLLTLYYFILKLAAHHDFSHVVFQMQQQFNLFASDYYKIYYLLKSVQ